MQTYEPGMKVLHPLFGAGTIRAISGSGPDAKITVEFSGSVGQKKLLASVANLTIAGANVESSRNSAPAATGNWYEILEASGALPRHIRAAEGLADDVNAALGDPQFWIPVRERLRQRGMVPKVLDDISGNVACAVTGTVTVKIVIRHAELVRPQDAALAQAIFDELCSRELRDIVNWRTTVRVDVTHGMPDEGVIDLQDSELGPLPDRAPRGRPRPVAPKGVIRPRVRRRDDY